MITIWGERMAAILGAIIAIYFIQVSWDFPANGNIFPLFCGVAALIVATLMIVRTIVSPAVFLGRWPKPDLSEDARALLVTAISILYVIMIFQLGYYISSILFFLGLSQMAKVRSRKAIVITIFTTFPLIYIFFEVFLNTQMPRGLLF